MSKGIIYCAHCLSTGKKYIGQTIRKIEKRINQHILDSKKKSLKFYRAANKYGWNSFIWGIIEECNVEFLNDREFYWIDYFDTYENGYNSTHGGQGGFVTICKEYELMSPTGNVVRGKNISKLCRENNLSINCISDVIHGKCKSHKGWKLKTTTSVGHEATAEKKSKYFKIKNPQGEIVEEKNIRKFCRDNNLNLRSFNRLLAKQIKSHKGWTLPETNNYGSDLCAKPFKLKNPFGEIIEGINLNKFCRENCLPQTSMNKLVNNKLKSYKGWTIP